MRSAQILHLPDGTTILVERTYTDYYDDPIHCERCGERLSGSFWALPDGGYCDDCFDEVLEEMSKE